MYAMKVSNIYFAMILLLCWCEAKLLGYLIFLGWLIFAFGQRQFWYQAEVLICIVSGRTRNWFLVGPNQMYFRAKWEFIFFNI
jgi:hypothetical protein